MMFWILLILTPILVSAAIAGIKGAPWVPTKRGLIEHLAKTLPIKPGMKVYDLGCGDGRVLQALARQHPHALYEGHELSLLPFFVAKLRSRTYTNISIAFKDVLHTDYADADLIFLFWMNDTSKKLLSKIASDLKPTCLIAVEGWKPATFAPVQTIITKNHLPLYLYRAEQWLR